MKYTNYGLSLLGDLDRYYKKAAIEVKSKIVSSMFPEKLIFEEKKYRTLKVNEVLSLITSNINELGIPKMEKAAKNDSLYHMAGPTGLEPATFGLTGRCANQAAPRPHFLLISPLFFLIKFN